MQYLLNYMQVIIFFAWEGVNAIFSPWAHMSADSCLKLCFNKIYIKTTMISRGQIAYWNVYYS